MASINIVLRRKKNKDGTFPIVLRLTKDRQTAYLYLAKNVKENEWDNKHHRVKNAHPNSKRLNNFLLKRLTAANDILLELESQEPDFSLQRLKEKITKKGSPLTFFGQADLYLETIKQSGNFNRHSAEKPAVNHFKRFLKDKDIAFQDITVQVIERFKAYLKEHEKVSERTAINNLIVIRTIFNRAIQEGIARRSDYPFGKGKFRLKRPESLKIGLEKEEIIQLENLDLDPARYEYHARNVWLFSFYFAGMRVSDVLLLKWSDFENDRLHYVMQKNNKVVSLKIPNKAQEILKQYKELSPDENDLVFPDLKGVGDLSDKGEVQKKIKYRVKRLNKALKNIAEKLELNKPLTMHISRHSFGNISGDKIPVQKLQQLYRHSSILTTIGYQKAFMYKSADDALDAVLDF